MTQRILVFTDLDGTLLDHHSYSYEAARPALEALAERDIPLVIATSKTRAEVLALRKELGNQQPFVVENGGAVHVPAGYFNFDGAPPEVNVLGVDYAVVREAVVAVRERLQLGDALLGFGDVDAAGVAALTGLALADAALARQRESSEPLRVQPGEPRLAEFCEALSAYGLTTKQGGRFLHVQGPVDKAQGLTFVRDCFQKQYPDCEFVTVALGDSNNDLGMLQAADVPIVIPPGSSSARRLEVGREDAILPSAPGPHGFRQGIETMLSRLSSPARPRKESP